MADNFYTSVIQRGNYLLVREIKDGKRVSQKIRWRPTFYGPTNKKSELRVRRVSFYRESRESPESPEAVLQSVLRQ